MRTLILTLAITGILRADKLVLVAGGGDGQDGSPATKSKLITPFGCDFDSEGRMYFVEFEKANRLRMMALENTIKTVAGSLEKGSPSKSRKPLEARFNGPHGLAIHRAPNAEVVFIADTWNNGLQRFNASTGEIVEGFIDRFTHGKETPFKSVFAVSMDDFAHRLIITDLTSRQVYSWSVDGPVVETILAGNGKKGIPVDGRKAIDEPLLDPRAAAADQDGNVYILERGGHCLRVLNKDGNIRTVAGTGKAGTAVGKALECQMNGPKHLCIDKDGSVIIADAENHRILRYIPKEEKVVVLAGTGKKGSGGLDGDPLKVELNRPHGVTVHPKTGELYICDSYNDRIVRIVKTNP